MKSLRLLIIEDSEDDAMLMELELRMGGFDPDCLRVETPQELESALEKNWDAVISDYNMPAFTGLDALRIIQAKGLDLPFILVSGVIGEEKAVEAMKAGAHDFILKANLARLGPTLERELEEASSRRGRREAEEALRRAHEELEQRVAERTSELAKTNEVLRSESPLNCLSRREREVLQLLAEGKNTKEAAFVLEVSDKTVETHRAHIMRKLNIHSLANLTKFAIREGLTTLD